MKLLRTIRLDASDSFVFEKAAEPRPGPRVPERVRRAHAQLPHS
jgi:hypothetical protein